MFKDAKHFDTQKTVIGSLIREVDIGKKKDLRKFLDKAPDIRDLEIQSRLKKFSEKNEFSTEEMVAAATIFSLLQLLLLHHLLIFLIQDHHLRLLIYIPNVLRVDKFINNNDFNFGFSNSYVPLVPDPPSIRRFAGNFFRNRPLTAKTSSNVGTNSTQTMSGDSLIGELERVIEKRKSKRKNCPR